MNDYENDEDYEQYNDYEYGEMEQYDQNEIHRQIGRMERKQDEQYE